MFKSLSKSVAPSLRTLGCRGYFYSCSNFGVKLRNLCHARPLIGSEKHFYRTDSHGRVSNYYVSQAGAHLGNPCYFSAFPPVSQYSRVPIRFPVISPMPMLAFQAGPSLRGTRWHSSNAPDFPEDSGTSQVDVGGDSGFIGTEWVDKLKEGWQPVADILAKAAQRAKEISAEPTAYVEQLLDSHPYTKDVFVPVGGTLTATLMAWLVMPKVLRRLHKYSTQGSAVLLPGSMFGGEVPYEKSFWAAVEDPLRYLVTFLSFSQIATMVAPTAIASQYIAEAWRGAIIVSFVWFLHRWKTNVFSRALETQSFMPVDRERLLTLDRVSSVGLFVIGLMAFAEACGVAVQSVLTVGGIGGVATAFAARDILGNILSGLSMQLSRPFSLGDTIKAGSIEGQVVEMGLTTTSLLSVEKFPVIVPNSMFSSQVIINKSRAPWRALVSKIPLQFDNLEKVPQVAVDIKSMLLSHPKVFLGKEAPFCYLSQILSSYAELTVGCNLNQMSKYELFATQQDILLQSVQIIRQHGISIGSSYQDTNNQ